MGAPRDMARQAVRKLNRAEGKGEKLSNSTAGFVHLAHRIAARAEGNEDTNMAEAYAKFIKAKEAHLTKITSADNLTRYKAAFNHIQALVAQGQEPPSFDLEAEAEYIRTISADMEIVRGRHWKDFLNHLKRIEESLQKPHTDKSALTQELKTVIQNAREYCRIKKNYGLFFPRSKYDTYTAVLNAYQHQRLMPSAPSPTEAKAPTSPAKPKRKPTTPPPSPARPGVGRDDLQFDSREIAEAEADTNRRLAIMTGKIDEVIDIARADVKAAIRAQPLASIEAQANDLDAHVAIFARPKKQEESCFSSFLRSLSSCWSSLFSCCRPRTTVNKKTYHQLPSGPAR